MLEIGTAVGVLSIAGLRTSIAGGGGASTMPRWRLATRTISFASADDANMQKVVDAVQAELKKG